MSGTQLPAAAEKKQPTQTRYQQAVKSLQEYSGKAQASVSKFVRCLRGLEDCSKENISRARRYAGIVAAALAVLAIGGSTGFLYFKQKPPSVDPTNGSKKTNYGDDDGEEKKDILEPTKTPLFSGNLTEETGENFLEIIEKAKLTSSDITNLNQQVFKAYEGQSPAPDWLNELIMRITLSNKKSEIKYEDSQAKKTMSTLLLRELKRMQAEAVKINEKESEEAIGFFIDDYEQKTPQPVE